MMYPARHVSEPAYVVSIAGAEIARVELTSSLDATPGSREGGKVLERTGRNRYISVPEFGWIKIAFMVPVDAHKPIGICAIGDDGRTYHWSQNIGVFGGEYPEAFKFNCMVSSGILSCEKVST